jgi:hypothetical protein
MPHPCKPPSITVNHAPSNPHTHIATSYTSRIIEVNFNLKLTLQLSLSPGHGQAVEALEDDGGEGREALAD